MFKRTKWNESKIWSDIATKYNSDQLESVISIGENPHVNRIIDKCHKKIINKHILKNKIKINNAKTILDLGCGSGRMLPFLKNTSSGIYGLDFSFEMLNIAKQYNKNANLVCAGIENIPLKKNIIEIIISIGVVKYVSDIEQAAYEISQAIKENGYLIILDSPSDRMKYGYNSPEKSEKHYVASFEKAQLKLVSQGGVRWPLLLRFYRKIARKILMALIGKSIDITEEGQISFSPNISKSWESIYNGGLVISAYINFISDTLLSIINIKRLSYEKIFVFKKTK